jgi:hypothetical protein
MEFEGEIRQLILREGLTDMDRLLRRRSLDEVPISSRDSHIKFMAHLSACDQSKIMVQGATRYLRDILSYVQKEGLSNLQVMISISNWENLTDYPPTPVRINFWVCSTELDELTIFRLHKGASKRATIVGGWLAAENLLGACFVMEQPDVALDCDLYRLFIACRDSQNVLQYVA